MILTRLKQKTLWQRERLGKRLDLFHSVRTPDDYRLLLGRLLGFYEPVEATLEATFDWSAAKFDFASRKKTPLLLRDLHSMGIDDTLLLPRCKMLPTLNTLPQAFGCLYVFESATLSWGIVLSHMSRTIGVTRDAGGAFFNSYGDRVVAMWHDFAQQIRVYASRPDIEESVIRTAIDTLAYMDRWIAASPDTVEPAEQVEDPPADRKVAGFTRQGNLRLL
jgi:heme oxygenase